jgi:FlaA1/EpsC-like NDP-sugar epimerase
MNNRMKMKLLVLLDVFIIMVSVYSAYLMRFQGEIPERYVSQIYIFISVYVIVGIFIKYLLRFYRRMWQYAGIQELVSIFYAVTISFIISILITLLITGLRIPWSVAFHSYETNLLLIGATRLLWRIVKSKKNTSSSATEKNVLIIGAGTNAKYIIQELHIHKWSGMKPVVLIDDDPNKHGMQILGIVVYGGRDLIQEAVNKFNIEEIIIAMPSAQRSEISKMIEICKQTKASIKIIPKINDLISGKVSLNEIRNVELEDLLGREPIQSDVQAIASYGENKVILVTGAGGSIGSELCRQIAQIRPQQLILLGHGENSIYRIEMELLRLYPDLTLHTVIADVQDQNRINQVFEMYRPQVVFHAAAHKHVPLMEKNPSEAIKNNVLGTKHVAQAANRFDTERFVLISTDKAVNPSSVMGVTKRIAEMIILSMNIQSKTIYTAVRFGNVIGSNGSVIPKFKEQIQRGGPVTVTHPEMTRYFMTIPEAVQLVIQAGAYAKGGEIFILDMGKPVRILDLALDLIQFSGFEPHQDIEIVFTGIRQGEKLHEELLTNEEGIQSTKHNHIFVCEPTQINYTNLEYELKSLEKILGEDQESVRALIQRIVPSFKGVS